MDDAPISSLSLCPRWLFARIHLLVWEKKRALLHKFTTRVVKIAVGFRCKERKSAVFFVTLRHLSARLVVLGA